MLATNINNQCLERFAKHLLRSNLDLFRMPAAITLQVLSTAIDLAYHHVSTLLRHTRSVNK
jgi:hypothetical protein